MRDGNIDWSRVVWDLHGRGLSSIAIAGQLRVNRTTVMSWRDKHRQPSGTACIRLLLLWGQWTGNDPYQPPVGK